MGRRTTGQLWQRGKTWYLTYIHQGQKRTQSLGTTSKAAAKRKREELLRPFSAGTEADQRREAAAALEAALDVARRADAEANRIPLAEVWERFPYDHTAPGRGPRRRLSLRNTEENRTGWQKFLRWVKEASPATGFMEEVTPDMAKAWVRGLETEERLTGGRINKLVTIVRNMYKLAGRASPFTAVERHAVIHESRVNLEVEDLLKVCSAAAGELQRLLAIMLYTGLRLGDSVTLDWSHFSGDRVSRITAKTSKRVSFPVHPELAAVLGQVPAADRRGPVCPELAAEYRRDHTRTSKRIRAHFQRCGVTVVEEVEGLKRRVSRRGAHAFRHSFVTLAARGGVPIGVVRQWVGHSSELVTRIYEHWGTEGQDLVLAALPSMGWAEPLQAAGAAPVALQVPAVVPLLPAAPQDQVSPAAAANVRAAIAILEAATAEIWETSRADALRALRSSD